VSERLANKLEFKKANRILHQIKSADGKIALYDALDAENISIWWWKAHKSWFLERFHYIRIEADPDEEHPVKYLVNTEVVDN